MLFSIIWKSKVDLEYAFYWKNIDDIEPYHAMAIFCTDGSLILGLSATVDVCESIAKDYLNRMKISMAADAGYCALEYAPARSKRAFYDDCKMWENYCS
jgi:hypothetical protein